MQRWLAWTTMVILCGCGGSDGSVKPLLSDIQQKIFNVSCTFSVCHDSRAKKGDLDLSPGTARASLVNVAAFQESAKTRGKIRVVPGNPDGSFLIHKLDQNAATLSPDEGDGMPQTGSRLPQPYIDAIRTWIAEGAQDN